MGTLSSLAILMAIAFLYSITGALNIKYLALRLAETPYFTVASVAFGLLVIGFSLKAAIFPLHVGLPDAHSIALSPVSAILSGLVVNMGVIGLFRTFQIYRLNSQIGISTISAFLTWLGIISIFAGGFFAFFQDDIKRILVYSTISNIGYIYLGIGLNSYYGMIGGVIHVFEHTLIKTLLFLCVGAIIYQTGSQKLSELKGVGHKMPVTATTMAIGIVSIIGFPPTNGFVGKWFIVLGAVQANKAIFALAILLGILPTLVSFIKVVNVIFFQSPSGKIVEVREAPLSMCIPMILLGGLLIIFGVLAYLPLPFVEKVAAGLLRS
jgi:multicomponent Na+:H+ antiporter subunit D